MQNIDAGALVALVRRKGRVGYQGGRGISRYKNWAAAGCPADGHSTTMHVRAIRENDAGASA
jgi:hypothetical protein